MIEIGEVQRIILAVVTDRFPGGKVESVKVRRDTDYEGEPILLIEVIIDQTGGALDSKRATGLARHVRSRLAAVGEPSFPLFSFISKTDVGKLKTATA